MTAAPPRAQVVGVDADSAGDLARFLTAPRSAAEDARDAVLRHQHLLDALERGEYSRLLVWPGRTPRAVAHVGATGTLVVAGDPAGGRPLARALEGSGWRVLLGDADLGAEVLAGARGLLRRRPRAREQRYMALRAAPSLAGPPGLRRAAVADLAAVTELACRLHVEDRMGPPLSRPARAGVTERMRASIARGDTWVVADEGGAILAKVDVSLASPRWGAQIAGVYVVEEARGRGLAAGATAAVAGGLLARGLPGVTLHVRSDNLPGRRAYTRAGFVDGGAWLLALR